MLKNTVILGDSYSTFTGHIPEDHGTYYDPAGPWYVRAKARKEWIATYLRWRRPGGTIL